MAVTTALLSRDDGSVREDDPAARATRRRFTAEYKLEILQAYERLSEPGAKAALLRREGLYTSHIVEWRRARDAGAPRHRGKSARALGAALQERGLRPEVDQVMEAALSELEPLASTKRACEL